MAWYDDMPWGDIISGTVGGVIAGQDAGRDDVSKPYYLPGQEKQLADATKGAQDLYNMGPEKYYEGDTIAGRNPLLDRGQDSQLAQNAKLKQLGNNSGKAALELSQGGADRIGGFQLQDQVGFGIPEQYQKAIMDPIMNNLHERTLPGLEQQATAQGAFGGTRAMQQKADAATQATTAATNAMIQGNLQARAQTIGQRGQDHQAQLQGRGQDVQQNALENQAYQAGIAGTANAQQNILNPGQNQAAIGAERTQYEQSLIDADRQRWDFNQQAPGNALDGLIARTTLTQPTRGAVQQNTASPLDYLGGAITGMNVYNNYKQTT